mgnify:CR=1 FL=1
MKLSDKAYDILKWICMIALNAVGVCYKTIATIWGLPYGNEVCATCAAVALCIGTLIGISTAEYYRSKE